MTPPSRTPKYDPEKAKSCSRKPASRKVPRSPVGHAGTASPTPNAKLMAEMLQSDWAKIGIKQIIVSYEWGEYIKRSKGGENRRMLIGWSGDNGDPDNWLNSPVRLRLRVKATTSPNGATRRSTASLKQAKAPPTWPSAPSCTSRRNTSSRSSSDDTYRSLDGVPTHARQREGLQDQPVWLELLLWRQRRQIRCNGDVSDVAVVYPGPSKQVPYHPPPRTTAVGRTRCRSSHGSLGL